MRSFGELGYAREARASYLCYGDFGGKHYFDPVTLLGLGIGAETDLMSFLVTRYLGIRAFGGLYGLMFSVFVLGNAAGAASLGSSFQLLHSYEPASVLFEVLLILACILFATLGPYRYPAAGER